MGLKNLTFICSQFVFFRVVKEKLEVTHVHYRYKNNQHCFNIIVEITNLQREHAKPTQNNIITQARELTGDLQGSGQQC